jgi:branched-chain amino acid transport system ATP-binding protein
VSRAILSCEDVAKSFGGVAALTGVSVDVAPAEILGIVGSNGAGKSTLLNVISGQHRPDRGTIRLGDRRIDRLSPTRIFRLGLGRTFQDARVFGSLTAYQNVLLAVAYAKGGRPPLRFTSQMRDTAEEALETVALSDQASQPAVDLTVFEQKRLMLAGAIATRPAVLLMDEPASALTPAEVTETSAILRSLKEQHATAIVVVEHVISFIRDTADRVVVLHGGQALVSGTLAEVVGNPEVRLAWLGESADQGLPA